MCFDTNWTDPAYVTTAIISILAFFIGIAAANDDLGEGKWQYKIVFGIAMARAVFITSQLMGFVPVG